ncbi:MAG: hypothetical protein HYY16_05490, partial [Planctomycetes bacterium]|nr:hypothetical protein [Planctomycetota bacterium]
ASLSARFAEDLDGERDEAGFFAFDSLDDSYRRAATSRLYTAFVDLHRPMPNLRARAGRLIVEEMPEAVPMDGGQAWLQIQDHITAAVFGGLPVNLFESSTSDDAMYGGWIEALPWTRTRARIEYLHLRDENAFGLFKDDLVGFSVEHGSGPFFTWARYTVLESENRDVAARLTGTFPAADLVIDIQGTYLFETQHAQALAIDPYSVFLFELEPYAQLALRASKGLGSLFSVDASATLRELIDDDEETPFNHEFQRWNVTPRTADWPLPKVSIAVPLDFWETSNDDFWTAGADVAWQAHPALSLTTGTSFSLYVIDAFAGTERRRVRSIYAAARWTAAKGTAVDLRYSIDRDDFDTFNTLEIGGRRAF